MATKVFYLHFANTIVPVKFTSDYSVEDVRAAVNDALMCLDKVPLADEDPIILRDVHGEATEVTEGLEDLQGSEFFLDLGDGSWKWAQIIYSKLQEGEEAEQAYAREEDIAPQAEEKFPDEPEFEEIPEEPYVVAPPPPPEVVESAPPPIVPDPNKELNELKSLLSSEQGMSFSKMSRKKKVQPRRLCADENFDKFSIMGGKSGKGVIEFFGADVDKIFFGPVSPELQKAKPAADEKICCSIKLRKRFISLVFTSQVDRDFFCNNFSKLINKPLG
eukprot:Filipodium_phascolosomae@DN6665_c0_g1_i1.p1